MSGFRLRINALENIPQASPIQAPLSRQAAFEVEYFFRGQGNYTVVQPMLVSNVIVFLANFPDGQESPMALVYNSRDEWSDIEKESTGLTDAIGQAIENYYSNSYLPTSSGHLPKPTGHLPKPTDHLPKPTDHLPKPSEHLPKSSQKEDHFDQTSDIRSFDIQSSGIKSPGIRSSDLQSSEIHLLN